VLGVERPQRVLVDPVADVVGELRLAAAQIGDQLVAVGGAGLRRAEASQPKLERRHPEPPQQLVEQQDQLGVDQRRVGADRLGIDLGELAKPPRLGALVPEHRPVPPQLHRLRELLHPVLDVGPDDRGGALRT
jgi:hypothetical protein